MKKRSKKVSEVATRRGEVSLTGIVAVEIDPLLQAELDTKSATETVGAIVRFRPTQPGLHAPPPAEVELLAKEIIGRVSAASGSSPGVVTVMRNLGPMSLRANVDFIRRLVREKEVAAAVSSSHRVTPV